jgi:hypothetical protein
VSELNKAHINIQPKSDELVWVYNKAGVLI